MSKNLVTKRVKVLKELKNIIVNIVIIKRLKNHTMTKHLASKRHNKKSCHEIVTKLSRNVTKKV